MMNDRVFTAEQIEFIKSLSLKPDFENLTDDDLVQIEEVIGEKLQKSGFDRNYEVTAVGRMCESILDRLT
ncbi:MAG TPA: hypothetical protein GX401_03300 [Clostridiales bacterium]|nr:hypothetical protein [Clostridiales bacterium]